MSEHDEFMDLALTEASKGRGAVEPNPMVGAVLVKDGRVIAAGGHMKFGGPHAEIEAIRAAGPAAAGSTLYVTLEPCAHHGKTPPCADAVIAAGITRVVAAMRDPNPVTSGKGFQKLRDADVTVIEGVLEQEAVRLNAPYVKLITTGTPYVTAKWAMTLDGRIATPGGQSRWISCEDSRRSVHELRGRMDAVAVGIGTALADDPLLTARGTGPRVPARIVLDSRCRMPLESQLLRTLADGPVLVAASADAPGKALERLQAAGAEVLTTSSPGRVDPRELLAALGDRGMTNVLLEGGGTVLGSFFRQGLVDAAKVFVCPKIFAGDDAPGPVRGGAVDLVDEALHLQHVAVSQLGSDVLIEGTMARH
jgi:diaminohydroxyphosphoribosylaminopyrimidine deaminase/5-amino-6-(5-phosphoribosylamino)uracil reductase